MGIEEIIYRMEQLMYGVNYEVCFGVEIFDDCSTIENFKLRLKEKFPFSYPEKIDLISFTMKDFWKEINYGLDYRGGNSVGLFLNNEDENRLQMHQVIYKDFINQFLNGGSKIYSYPDMDGIP